MLRKRLQKKLWKGPGIFPAFFYCNEARICYDNNMNLVQQWERVRSVRSYGVSYPHQTNDGGRSTSRRPKQKNDCMVRALALVCGIPYDTAYDWFAAQGRRCSRGTSVKAFDTPSLFGHRLEKLSFHAVAGERRMNPVTFAERYKTGKYIVRVAKHVFAFIDGVAYDIHEERDDRCIYVAWRFTPET